MGDRRKLANEDAASHAEVDLGLLGARLLVVAHNDGLGVGGVIDEGVDPALRVARWVGVTDARGSPWNTEGFDELLVAHHGETDPARAVALGGKFAAVHVEAAHGPRGVFFGLGDVLDELLVEGRGQLEEHARVLTIFIMGVFQARGVDGRVAIEDDPFDPCEEVHVALPDEKLDGMRLTLEGLVGGPAARDGHVEFRAPREMCRPGKLLEALLK